MNDLRSHLKRGDPLVHEDDLPRADFARMRAEILSATPEPAARRGRVVLPIAVILLCVSAGSMWFVRTSSPESEASSAPIQPRQLQFATAGGTRVIWTFNPNFELR